MMFHNRDDKTPINVDVDDDSDDNKQGVDDDDDDDDSDDKRDDSDEEGFDNSDDNSRGIDDDLDDKRDDSDDNCDKSDDYSDCGSVDTSDDSDDIKDDDDVDDYSGHDENSEHYSSGHNDNCDDRNDDNRDHDYYSSDDTCSDNTEKNSDVIDGGVTQIKRDVIDHCILDGLEYKLNHQCKLIHDGQNLLIFSDDKIILLETLTNGSKAHLVVSGLEIITEVHAKQGLGINYKGQLMVCADEDSIKIYEYSCIPRSLQDLCRCCISEAIPSRYQESIEELSLPEIISDYLLYKDLGY